MWRLGCGPRWQLPYRFGSGVIPPAGIALGCDYYPGHHVASLGAELCVSWQGVSSVPLLARSLARFWRITSGRTCGYSRSLGSLWGCFAPRYVPTEAHSGSEVLRSRPVHRSFHRNWGSVRSRRGVAGAGREAPGRQLNFFARGKPMWIGEV